MEATLNIAYIVFKVVVCLLQNKCIFSDCYIVNAPLLRLHVCLSVFNRCVLWVNRSLFAESIDTTSIAWCGFISATDRERLDAFIRRSERSHLVPPNLPSFAKLCRTTDDRLFNQILSNKAHVLNDLLPPTSVASQNYNLCQWRHHNLFWTPKQN